MVTKKTILASILAMGMSLPLFAHAFTVTIVNNTNHDSTSVINDGFCSTTVLGKEGGTTRAHNTKVIPQYQINTACMRNLKQCKVDIYMTDNCTGEVISTVYFNVKDGVGILSVTPPKQGYTESHSAFGITFSDGPAVKAKA